MKVIKLQKNNLYVLRYKRFGHYYVGTAERFDKRMFVHWRRTSKLPEWSILNESKQGFIFYWFYIEGDGVSRSKADLCENHLAKLIARKIKYINEKNFIKEVHVGNNNFIDGKPENNKEKYINRNDNIENKMEINDIEKEVYDYLKKLRSLKPLKIKKRLSIKCCRIGYIEEFHQNQCHKSWEQVETLEFSCDN